VADIGWYRPDGSPMSEHDWQVAFARSLGVFFNGDGIDGRDQRGHPVRGSSFYLIINAGRDGIEFTLPSHLVGEWMTVFDTAAPRVGVASIPVAQRKVEAAAHAMVLLQQG
jgi:glycogen operon protein